MNAATTRAVSFALIGVGALVLVLGVVNPFSSDSTGAAGATSAAATTTTSSNPAANTITATTTTTEAATTAPTATTTSTTTTSTSTTTTTTSTTTTTTTTVAKATPAELIVAFVDKYVAAIDGSDFDFLFDRLHPAVLDQFDADLCRTFIEREILALGNYRLTGDVTGPSSQTIGGSQIETYTAPAAFDFQGRAFDLEASYGFVDDEVRWFTSCR